MTRHPIHLGVVWALLMLVMNLYASNAQSVTSPAKIYASSSKLHKASKKITVPSNLKNRVRFWEKIFAKYPSTTTVIHDIKRPWIIIDVIDHRVLAMKKKKIIVPNSDERKLINQRYINRYNLALKRFKTEGKRAIKYGAIEKRVYSVYRKHRLGLINLYKGNHSLRSQTGLADEFIQAMVRSKHIIPLIEKIFVDEGIPYQLSRLAFVESMFRVHARSKVGAAGIWQFMRATGKQFMKIDHIIDQRYEPLKASEAAAKLLARNFKSLKSWSLAVTAYNHGSAGVAKAVRTVGSTNLGRLIERYRGRSFGFASQNFFAEFLAASKVYEKNYNRGLHLTRIENDIELRHMTLSHHYSVHQLLNKTPLTLQTLERYNPAISRTALTKYRFKPLPIGLELNVPSNIFLSVREKLIKMSPKRLASTKRRVRR